MYHCRKKLYQIRKMSGPLADRNLSRGSSKRLAKFANLYALLKNHLAAAAFGGGVFADADAEFVVGSLFAIE